MGIVAWLRGRLYSAKECRKLAPGSDAQPMTESLTRPSPRVVLDAGQRSAISAALCDHWETEAILIHGGAGTGKSEVVRRIARKLHGRAVIVAPTGIAAHNIEGVTVHSQFGFPGTVLRYRSDAVMGLLDEDVREALRRSELIIIDEISMVRADLLDAIDWALRVNLENLEVPFGGKRIAMVGDLLQLEPVAPTRESQILKLDWPDGCLFFDAHVWKCARFRAFELSTVHRQSADAEFAHCLRELRAENPERAIAELNDLLRVAPEPRDRPILVTLNKRAANINTLRLREIPSPEKVYASEPEGEFPDDELRAPKRLVLKLGARVLLTANSSGGHPYQYVNGTLGIVERLLDHSVTIKRDDGGVVTIRRHLWEHKKYVRATEPGKIRLQTVGTFRQFPIRLAWAMNVHKSQGLTFAHQHIDTTQPFFASGQGYVALTRCRSSRGLTVSSPIDTGIVWWDARLRHFLALIEQDPMWPPLDQCRR